MRKRSVNIAEGYTLSLKVLQKEVPLPFRHSHPERMLRKKEKEEEGAENRASERIVGCVFKLSGHEIRTAGIRHEWNVTGSVAQGSEISSVSSTAQREWPRKGQRNNSK